jgi:16S rRNA (adenine1518-N6/adenine1519-N6)-dimethyltransferase
MQRDEAAPNLTRLSDVRTLVTQLGFHPSRALGQNFLIDRNILDILIESAGVTRDDTVLEVGPGLGVVTERLLDQAGQLIAVEKDHRLYAYLQDLLSGRDRLDLIQGDVLEVGISALLARGVNKVVSNLPYSPGSRILLDLICDAAAPRDIAVTVQLEVAQRITASPGGKTYGLMGVWCQLHCEVALVKVISPNCFWPRPDVKSAIVTLRRRPEPLLSKPYEKLLYRLTRHTFQQRRKQLASCLAKAPDPLKMDADSCRALLTEIGATPEARPEALSVDQWCRFTEALFLIKESR